MDSLDKEKFFMVHFDGWKRDYYFKSFHRPEENRKAFDKRVYELGLQKLKEVDKK